MASRKSTRRQVKSAQQASANWTVYVVSLTIAAVLVGAVVSAYVYLSQPGRMPLRVVQVQGEFQHLTTSAIQQTAGAAIDGGFFTCDMPKLRNAILAMPWVADVSIRRVWPDRLNMQVTERMPLARWGDDALVSADALIFSPKNLDDYANLVKLDGPSGSAQRVVSFYRAALPAIQVRGLEVRQMTLDERRHWWVYFDSGLTLSLGRESRDARLAQFLRVYPRLIADKARQPLRVGMRYAHGFAVSWRDEEAADAASDGVKTQEKV